MFIFNRLKILFLVLIFALALSSCLFSGSSKTGLSSQVAVRVVSQFSDSTIRTSSGKPYISLFGGPRVCRFRPFTIRAIRDELLDSGVSKDVLNDYIISGNNEENEGDSDDNNNEDNNEDNARDETAASAIFVNVADNWLKFGLQIANNTDFVLIVDSVRLSARAKCGKVYTHNDVIQTGYCATGEGVDTNSSVPFLYIIPPKRTINYQPISTNPFHNLTLYFAGFEIEDRREQDSTRFAQSIRETNTNSQSTQQAQVPGNLAQQSQQECQPNREDYAIPRYKIELTLTGYFLGLSKEYTTLDFTKRLTFFTSVIY